MGGNGKDAAKRSDVGRLFFSQETCITLHNKDQCIKSRNGLYQGVLSTANIMGGNKQWMGVIVSH